MADESNNTIDLKKRARRRLVGAAALALIAIILLPAVMDSQPKPTGQDIQIRIPNQDGEASTVRDMPGNAVPPVPVLKGAEPPVESSPSAAASLPKLAVESGTRPVTPELEGKPLVTPKPKTEPSVVKDETAKKTETARAVAALEGKDSGQWIVQLGAYRNATTVKNLSAKLREAGLPVYVEKTDSPSGATRVRAGPFDSRESAEKAKKRAGKIGVDGLVVQKQ